MRLVLDINIVVSALIWGRQPRQLIELARDEKITLFTISSLLDELAHVLARKKFAALLESQAIIPAFVMQRYGLLATLVTPQNPSGLLSGTPMMTTALAARADMIVTGDKDLLVLHPYEDMPILDAAAALQRLQTYHEEEHN